ncbi:MAG: alpha-ketoacid dehydrogenase subunit beta [Gemmatimonadetes bacterium]|nr:alpha-ketoacid dehydrogenase subunit beta [Gemmatimonadota bacterium]|tara:strand:+ start:2231 stop:3271 length:1041 start_codon:yes stop_codon:yes gene_type:complete
MRPISFCQALHEAAYQEMERDPTVFVYGIGVPTPPHIFGSLEGFVDAFGPERCFDTPVSEESMVGFGLGAAMSGLRPIHVHIRVDFLLLAMNQLVNMVSNYIYSTVGRWKVPLVIRAIVGRGWGQGSQHSKSLHSYFSHIPGLKVVIPTTPRDAKGLLTSAIRDDNPVVFIEHRWLYWAEEDVPEGEFVIPIGKSQVLRDGSDITIVATSWMNVEALKAAEILARHGVSVEIVDPRTIAPLDETPILESVEKTGHCIVADNDWCESGFSAEIAARVSEKCFGRLKSPVGRIGFAFTPCPTVRCLENEFYPNAVDIVRAIERKLGLDQVDLAGEDFYSHERRFKGPF